MKVYDLGCEHDHRFEGWFGSADDFDHQSERGLVECPLCGSRSVRKLLSAPRLNLSSTAHTQQAQGGPAAPRSRPVPAGGAAADAAAADRAGAAMTPARMQAMWMRLARHVMANTEDVGKRFAEEARLIHDGEAPERAIRGVATPEQAAALADDGIAVVALPLPLAAKETLQ